MTGENGYRVLALTEAASSVDNCAFMLEMIRCLRWLF